MKTTTIQCDYCKTEIKEGKTNTLVGGKGLFDINFENEKYPAYLAVQLKTTTDKDLNRDICTKCLKGGLFQ